MKKFLKKGKKAESKGHEFEKNPQFYNSYCKAVKNNFFSKQKLCA